MKPPYLPHLRGAGLDVRLIGDDIELSGQAPTSAGVISETRQHKAEIVAEMKVEAVYLQIPNTRRSEQRSVTPDTGSESAGRLIDPVTWCKVNHGDLDPRPRFPEAEAWRELLSQPRQLHNWTVLRLMRCDGRPVTDALAYLEERRKQRE